MRFVPLEPGNLETSWIRIAKLRPSSEPKRFSSSSKRRPATTRGSITTSTYDPRHQKLLHFSFALRADCLHRRLALLRLDRRPDHHCAARPERLVQAICPGP